MLTVDAVMKRIESDKQLPYESIDNWAEAGEIDKLLLLASQLEKKVAQNREEKWRYDRSHNRIFGALSSTPGSRQFEAILTLISRPPKRKRTFRALACRLAAFQQLDTVEEFLLQHNEDSFELFVLMIQEWVVQGIHGLDSRPAISAFWKKVTESQHPMGRLPLALLPYERNLSYLRSHFQQDLSALSPPTIDSEPTPLADKPYGKKVIEKPIPEDELTSIRAAIVDWQQKSNGQIEIRRFQSELPLDSNDVLGTALLLGLGLECLSNTPPSDIQIRQVAPRNIVNTLFTAAKGGGAYGGGFFNAFGRLCAWESVAGIMGKSSTANIHDLHKDMDRMVWFEFLTTQYGWFKLVAWDIGIAVLDESRHSLTIVAATDED